MTLKEDKLKEIDEEIEQIYKNNKYPVASIDIIDKIIMSKPSEKVLDSYKYTYELYLEYINYLNNLSEDALKLYLKSIKNSDVIDNQKMETKDSFLISLYMQSERTHAIDTLLKYKKLNDNNLQETHKILTEGINENINPNYRNNNRRFVGFYNNGERCIEYMPIHYKYINEAMQKFFEYYNEVEKDENNLFIKPFKVHGIIAALQVFDDGNTRLARLLQNVKLYRQTNQFLNASFKSPIIYTTKQYHPFRKDYRALIKQLAINPNNDVVNEWLDFNLRRTEESLWMGNENIEKLLLRK